MGLLEGVKVLDFTTYAAGPACTRIFADWKAEVIKVEPIQGEAFRFWGRLLGAPIDQDNNPMFEIDNANKKGISIDLKTTEGKEIIDKLLEDTDIFITNYREKALESLQLTYETLSLKYPKLIYGYLSGYGSKGPLAKNPGFDVISFWARGGFLGFLGEPDAVPVSPLPATGDQISGTYLAAGILAALIGRDISGRGEKVEASLYHSALWSTGLFHVASNYWKNPKKSRFNPDSPLINCFRSNDNKWFCLAIMEHERYWPILCKCIERPELAEDSRYSTLKSAKQYNKEITNILDEAFLKKSLDEWKTILTDADIPFDQIYDSHDINKDEQALVNDYIRPITMPDGNTVILPTTPCHFKEEGVIDWMHSPQIGQDTEEILTTLGYSKEQFNTLLTNNIIKTSDS